MTDNNEGFAPTPESWVGPAPYNAKPETPPCNHWPSRMMCYSAGTDETESKCQKCGEWFELLERSP